MRVRFINLLRDYKQILEYYQLTDIEEYKEICFRLKLFFEAGKELKYDIPFFITKRGVSSC